MCPVLQRFSQVSNLTHAFSPIKANASTYSQAYIFTGSEEDLQKIIQKGWCVYVCVCVRFLSLESDVQTQCLQLIRAYRERNYILAQSSLHIFPRGIYSK